PPEYAARLHGDPAHGAAGGRDYGDQRDLFRLLALLGAAAPAGRRNELPACSAAEATWPEPEQPVPGLPRPDLPRHQSDRRPLLPSMRPAGESDPTGERHPGCFVTFPPTLPDTDTAPSPAAAASPASSVRIETRHAAQGVGPTGQTPLT